MEELKGLILSGGSGSRMQPITRTSAKQLLPVANKPVLFYGIEALVQAGIAEIGMVIDPETGGGIREAVGDGSRFNATITYIEQDQPRGLAHALLTAEDFVANAPVVMYLGDNLLREGIVELVTSYRASEADALMLLTQVNNPTAYGVAELDGDRVVRLVEKPEHPPSDLAVVGVYVFGPAIFEAARSVKLSARGELEITDAINVLIESDRRVESLMAKGWWKDTGRLEGILEANRLMLDDLEPRIDGELIDSPVEGRVVVEGGARLERTTVRGPAVIGADTKVSDSYIGPYTAIDSSVTLTGSEIENSIVLAGSKIHNSRSRIEASLLGDGVTLARSDEPPVAARSGASPA